jgi:hypothetical protein
MNRQRRLERLERKLRLTPRDLARQQQEVQIQKLAQLSDEELDLLIAVKTRIVASGLDARQLTPEQIDALLAESEADAGQGGEGRVVLSSCDD